MNERDEDLNLTQDEKNTWWDLCALISSGDDAWCWTWDASMHLLNTAPEQQS